MSVSYELKFVLLIKRRVTFITIKYKTSIVNNRIKIVENPGMEMCGFKQKYLFIFLISERYQIE